MLFSKKSHDDTGLCTSQLFDEKTFYQTFIDDLRNCKSEVIVESPFITTERMNILSPIFKTLVDREVKVYVITRSPQEHNSTFSIQSEQAIADFEIMGVQVFLSTNNLHRKLAIIDREILWEGSLNILSQTQSREIMRRIEGKELAIQMFNFLKFSKFI